MRYKQPETITLHLRIFEGPQGELYCGPRACGCSEPPVDGKYCPECGCFILREETEGWDEITVEIAPPEWKLWQRLAQYVSEGHAVLEADEYIFRECVKAWSLDWPLEFENGIVSADCWQQLTGAEGLKPLVLGQIIREIVEQGTEKER